MRRWFVPIVLAVALAGCDWAQFRLDAAHSGASADSKVGRANVTTLAPSWTGATGAR